MRRLVVRASCVSALYERTGGNGVELMVKKRESLQDQGWLVCVGPCGDFFKVPSFVVTQSYHEQVAPAVTRCPGLH